MGTTKLIFPKTLRVKEIYKTAGEFSELSLDHPNIGKIIRSTEAPIDDSPFGYIYILEEIEDTPKELILCKDCKHRPIEVVKFVEGLIVGKTKFDDDIRDETCPFFYEDLSYSRIPPDDFYCAYGEKK